MTHASLSTLAGPDRVSMILGQLLALPVFGLAVAMPEVPIRLRMLPAGPEPLPGWEDR